MLLLFLFIALVLGGVIYAWGTYTAGTAIRHRDKLTPLFALALAAAYDARISYKYFGNQTKAFTDALENMQLY